MTLVWLTGLKLEFAVSTLQALYSFLKEEGMQYLFCFVAGSVLSTKII